MLFFWKQGFQTLLGSKVSTLPVRLESRIAQVKTWVLKCKKKCII